MNKIAGIISQNPIMICDILLKVLIHLNLNLEKLFKR